LLLFQLGGQGGLLQDIQGRHIGGESRRPGSHGAQEGAAVEGMIGRPTKKPPGHDDSPG
jgi:hypothetical protein